MTKMSNDPIFHRLHDILKKIWQLLTYSIQEASFMADETAILWQSRKTKAYKQQQQGWLLEEHKTYSIVVVLG